MIPSFSSAVLRPLSAVNYNNTINLFVPVHCALWQIIKLLLLILACFMKVHRTRVRFRWRYTCIPNNRYLNLCFIYSKREKACLLCCTELHAHAQRLVEHSRPATRRFYPNIDFSSVLPILTCFRPLHRTRCIFFSSTLGITNHRTEKSTQTNEIA